MPANTPASAGTRLEGLVLVLILIVVGGSAGAASFTHVHDWTMANSPANTPGWFGWANAVISELVPIAALLTIRRRRRVGAPIGYPMVLLIAAAGLSLAAQLAVAKPGPSGWLLSAVPALAFMALVKLVLAPAPAPQHLPPAAEPAQPIRVQVAEQVTAEPAPPAAITPAPEPTPAVEPVDVPAHLLPTARFAAVQHEQATGAPITPAELADRLDVTPAVAGKVLATIGGVR
ncbi:hypothetical protein GA0070607_2168 [Micromonospora coriariae]|uniref:DUF2637 domain-containing protein n=1 Tax=Micromonospora coriariae TaxID=285665 RepID=A0A1C4VIM2_9ACTN|nr:hypothetical protein [Micromonospora coriariae]SCE83661.1 hypothetical protein GA0070607_2168 [Micromonospora coriariae]